MIIVINRFDVVTGKMSEGLAWVDKLLAADKKAGLSVSKGRVLKPLTGTPRISLTSEFASMGEYEEILNKRSADSTLPAIIKELGTEGWCAGSERTIMQVVKET